MRQAVIGVVQRDGMVLTASAACGDGPAIHGILSTHYASAERATMLVSLGALSAIGSTPAKCTMPTNAPEPKLIGQADLERLALGRTSQFHIFDRGRWASWSDEPVSGEFIAFEAE